jgi:hypothetical protein
VEWASAYLDETQCFEPSDNLPRLEHGDVAHLCDLDRLGAEKIAFQRRLPVLQEHGHDLGEVLVQLVERAPVSR